MSFQSTSSSSVQLSDWVVGYICRNLLLRKYTSFSTINFGPPNDGLAEQRLAEAVYSLLRWHEPELRRLSMRRRRQAGGEAEMKRVLQQLSGHSMPLPHSLSQKAREQIPDLSAEVSSLLSQPPFQPFGQEDAQVLALAQCFKGDYMKWADPIPCSACQGKTKGVGSAEPTFSERGNGGGRVELHRCEGCGNVERFVRYGEPLTLMRERRGRCGEWAHLFYVFLLASGLKARYVWNSEDHVWTEYWSPTLNHWVHVDSCEATIGKPLLYARGWGKKQAFCIAVGDEGAEDVTKAYVDDWQACLGRRAAKKWGEEELQMALMEMTVRLRLRMDKLQQQQSEERDQQQAAWMADEEKRWKEAEKADLGSRVSGPEDWRAARDELGEKVNFNVPEYKVIHTLSAPAASFQGAVLTDKPGATGHVFPPERIPRDESWRALMDFRLTAPPGQAGADGIAVFFASEQKQGLGGYGLGYSGIGTTGDFAVEVDTFCSYDFAADPAVPHISVHSPPNAHHKHSVASTKAGALPCLNDGRVFTLDLIFDHRDRRLWGCLEIPGEREKMRLWEAKIPAPLAGEGTEPWWFGMTGSCGGLWQKQEILGWKVELVEIQRDMESVAAADVAVEDVL